MARQVRIEYEGATYHVMCRGDRREAIFDDSIDRKVFLATLGEVCRKTGWLVDAYVLMHNHYHLLLNTPQANLVAGMTWFQGTYTARYNARHGKTGHLFGGRYKAILVEADAGDYFRTLLDYIHLNPVRAGIIQIRPDQDDIATSTLQDYPWSSLSDYALPPSKRFPWLSVKRGLSSWELSDSRRGRREFIERLVERARQEKAEECGLAALDGCAPRSTVRRGWCFGTTEFKERMLSAAANALRARSERNGATYAGEEIREHNEQAAEFILAAGLSAQGLEEEDLPTLPKGALPKAVIAWKIRRETTVPLAWIAHRLRMGSASTVTRRCLEIETEIKSSRRLKKIARAMDARKLT